MNRYFLEVRYKGTHYAGFQIQQNAHTVQSAVEQALEVYYKTKIDLTGSSRTDAGVHALQNFFHFDTEIPVDPASRYNLNSILPDDISITNILKVSPSSHCRFDAVSRKYAYHVYRFKDPFLNEGAYYYPYALDFNLLQKAAEMIIGELNFQTFSKRNTQVKTYICKVIESEWKNENDQLIYYVKANRFLRGMVRGLVGTMLKVGRRKISVNEWKEILLSNDNTRADFSVPGKGLWLQEVAFEEGYFQRALTINDKAKSISEED